MRTRLTSAIRGILHRLDYVVWKREFLPYGLSPHLDVQRLSAVWHSSVTSYFDVGANIGQVSKSALADFPEATVFAFEPHAATFARLCSAVSDRRFKAFPIALSDHTGEAPFFEYGTEGDGTLINSLTEAARFPKRNGYRYRQDAVRCETLDEFCQHQEVDHIDVLKIDTEGHDLNVLLGGRGMLEAGRVKFVYVEFNDLVPEAGVVGGALLPIAEYLRPFGFRHIACYTDFVLPDGDLHVCANAMFARPQEFAR